MRQLYPQFARRGNHQEFMQQDAEECWTQLMTAFKQLPVATKKDSSSMDVDESEKFISQYMTGEFVKVCVAFLFFTYASRCPFFLRFAFVADELPCTILTAGWLQNGVRRGPE
jgi:hypothetical protein